MAALTHIALHVPELEPCVGFYRDYCGMKIVHDREDKGDHVVWMAEPGKEEQFVLVIIPGGPARPQLERDFSHLGFALKSAEAVEDIAQKAEQDGCLLWPPKREPYPVGYYCGVRDPAGNQVEFSFGQPLG